MKKLALLLITITVLKTAMPQSIGIGTTTPNTNAALDIESPTKGLLIPRITTAARNAITATKGLMVFDLTTNTFWFHTGADWNELATTSNTWSINGNTNTTAGSHFLGTIDNQPIDFRIAQFKAGRLDHIQRNYAFGFRALEQLTTGTGNIAIGHHALHHNNKNDLVAIGDSALHFNGLGWIIDPQSTENIGIGKRALYNNQVGYYNVAVGFRSMELNAAGGSNTAVGNYTLQRSNGHSNSAFGIYALRNNTTGDNNTAAGRSSLTENTIGDANTAIGYQAMRDNINGINNTAIGTNTMLTGASGNNNTAVGYGSMNRVEGENNSALGTNALYWNLNGDNNTAAGAEALRSNADGSLNVAVGFEALYSNNASRNTAVGPEAMRANTSGNTNVAVGSEAMLDNTSGSRNVAVGNEALRDNTTGSTRTAVGSGANATGTGFINNTGIGFAALCNASHQIRLGNVQVTSIGGVVGWTTVSDSRFKSNEKSDVQGLAFINALRPVSYNLNTAALENYVTRKSGKREELPSHLKSNIQHIRFTGFNAQEVETLARSLGFEFSGIDAPKNEDDYYGLRYGDFVVPLVKAVQEQQTIIDNLQKQIDELKKMINK